MPSLCLSIVRTILEFTVAENCSIMLKDSDSGNLKLFVAKGKGDRGSHVGSNRSEATILNCGEGIAGVAAESGEIVCVDDCETDDRFVELKTSARTVHSLISAPIVSDDAVLGVINCSHSKKAQFREIDKLNVGLVADHAAVLLQRAIATAHAVQERRALEKQVEDGIRFIEEGRDRQVEAQEQLYRSEKFVTLGSGGPHTHLFTNAAAVDRQRAGLQAPANSRGFRKGSKSDPGDATDIFT
jgi:GAF domain-containing protein